VPQAASVIVGSVSGVTTSPDHARRPAEPVGAHREPPPVIVSKPQAPSTELPPKEAILFDQIGDRLRSRRSSQPVDA